MGEANGQLDQLTIVDVGCDVAGGRLGIHVVEFTCKHYVVGDSYGW
jgi:hypothetical protein